MNDDDDDDDDYDWVFRPFLGDAGDVITAVVRVLSRHGTHGVVRQSSVVSGRNSYS